MQVSAYTSKYEISYFHRLSYKDVQEIRPLFHIHSEVVHSQRLQEGAINPLLRYFFISLYVLWFSCPLFTVKRETGQRENGEDIGHVANLRPPEPTIRFSDTLCSKSAETGAEDAFSANVSGHRRLH